jgi:methylamine dehydrogenase heavy chain
MTVVGRSEAHHEASIAVGGGDKPVLVGVDHGGGVHRYDVTTGDKVSLTETATRSPVAMFPTIVETDF